MTLEERIERFAESLPEGWRVVIEVERGSGTVTAVRPDGTEVDMGDGESSINQQFADAGRLAMEETEADKLSESECSSNATLTLRGGPEKPNA